MDECGIKEHLKREYGRSLRGVKIEDTKRGRSFHRTNIVAAQVKENNTVKKLAPLCYQGSMTGVKFENWVENSLIKCIGSDKVIIMDNAKFHRKDKLDAICKKANVTLMFLPPYSPDLNPIEKTWANMKRDLRDSAALCDLLETAVYKYWT